jgi:hypothetical protein
VCPKTFQTYQSLKLPTKCCNLQLEAGKTGNSTFINQIHYSVTLSKYLKILKNFLKISAFLNLEKSKLEDSVT